MKGFVNISTNNWNNNIREQRNQQTKEYIKRDERNIANVYWETKKHKNNARIQKSGSPVTVLVASLFVHRLNDIVYAFSSTMKG